MADATATPKGAETVPLCEKLAGVTCVTGVHVRLRGALQPDCVSTSFGRLMYAVVPVAALSRT